MSFMSFFSQQARKPTGWFGRIIMSRIFDKGNAALNKLMIEEMSLCPDDMVLEVGFGTGKALHQIAKAVPNGQIRGIDFSETMLTLAKKRNAKRIADGSMHLEQGSFDTVDFTQGSFTKICTANTIYFWEQPEQTAAKLFDVLALNGTLVVAFGDKDDLSKRPLDDNVFQLYGTEEVKSLLATAGFREHVAIVSRNSNVGTLRCAVAKKMAAS